MEKSQVHLPVHIQCTAHFLTHADTGEPFGALLHQRFFSGNVTAGARNAAAYIFNHGADHQVASHLYRLSGFHKFTVTVVHHNHCVRIGAAHLFYQPCNLICSQRRSERIAPGALDIGHLRAADCFRNSIIIRRAVCAQRHLLIMYTEVFQRAALFISSQTNNPFQRIIRPSGERHHCISGTENAEQCHAQCVGAGNEVVPHQSILCAKGFGNYPVQHLPSLIAVAIAGSAGQTRLAHPAFLKGGQHLGTVIGCRFLDLCKVLPAGALCLLRGIQKPRIQRKKVL